MIYCSQGGNMPKKAKIYLHHYPSDLTNDQWQTLEPLLMVSPNEPARTYLVRDIIDAILYFSRSGCAWRYLPESFPPWQNIQYYFYKWTRDGTWERVNNELCRQVRIAEGRNPNSTAGSVDAQSVKTTEKRGPMEASDMTPERRLKVVSDICSLIHSVS